MKSCRRIKIPTYELSVKVCDHTRVTYSYAVAIKYAQWQIEARGGMVGTLEGGFLPSTFLSDQHLTPASPCACVYLC